MQQLSDSQRFVGWRAAWCALTLLVGGGAALALLVLFTPVRPVAASDLNYPGCGPTIQACLDAATAGDSLIIAPGTYITSFTLNKAVSLLGSGPQNVALQALPNQRVLTVTGAAISNSVVISGLAFTGGSPFGVGCPDSCGGGILITGTAKPLLRNLIVATNTVGYRGGGVYAHQLSTVIIEDSLFFNNHAADQGGGLWAAFNLATVVNSRFENNHADGGQGLGGGILVGGYLTLNDTDLISNTATLGGGGAAVNRLTATGGQMQRNRCLVALCVGGGLYLTGESTLTNAAFVSNTARYGGAIYADTALTVTSASFLTNNAVDQSGGAIFMDTYLEPAGVLTLVDSTFTGNSALRAGGAVLSGGPATITGGRFEANHTQAGSGGGGGLMTADTLVLDGTAFVGNTTNGDGGGLNIVSGDARVTNDLFVANSASHGNAIAIGGDAAGSVVVLHSTITSPTLASGAAIYVFSGTVGVTNTILTHQATGIASLSPSVREDYNLYDNVTAPTSGVTSGGHSFVDDPGFVNAGAGNYHLAAGSSAINAGLNAGVFTDFDGDPRPMGGQVDIGFDEFLQPTNTLYLPLILR